LDEFLNHKQLTLLKAITISNDIVKIFCAQDVAIVFEFKGKYYPTLFMIWTFPQILPRLKSDNNLYSKLKTSTDLTVKDLNSITHEINNDHVLTSLPVDQCVSLCTNSCQKILGIGNLIMDGNSIKEQEPNRNKCLKVMHYYGDELYKSHILQIIPDVISSMEREFVNAPEINNGLQIQSEDNQTIVEKMDELFMTCSLKALKHSITKEMLPILASTFYKKYVMSFCPEGIELDIKKTSFKKLSTFLQLLDKEGIIKFNIGSNGIAEIVRIIHTNSRFQDANLEDNTEKENVDQFSPPVKEIYVVTPGLHPIFSEFLCR
jgi:translation initiation factor 2D